MVPADRFLTSHPLAAPAVTIVIEPAGIRHDMTPVCCDGILNKHVLRRLASRGTP